MNLFKKTKYHILTHALFITVALLLSGCKHKYQDLDLSAYEYRDTRNLIKFVYDAKLLLEKDGLKSINYFNDNRDVFKTADHYLYIYDMNGTCIYNAGMKYLEGRDLLDVTDTKGKKITRLVLNALKDKNNPYAWVHYSWWQPGKFYPVPKSSCHFEVTTPDNRKLFIGGGSSYPHEEKEFIRIIVDSAVTLIKKKGERAIAEISDSTSQYNYRDVRVFAFQPNGKLLISPVINDNLSQIDLINCADEVGHKPFQKALKALNTEDYVWEVFMAKNRYKRTLVKKCLYLRKTTLSTNELYIGAVTDLPEPPY